MKMVTTQVNGLLQRLCTENEGAIEDTARLLAQAAVGEGCIHFVAFDELTGVIDQALVSEEPFHRAVRFQDGATIHSTDRVWLFCRSADERALTLAKQFVEAAVPFACVSAEREEDSELASLAHTYLTTTLTKGLLPGPQGDRIVKPYLLAALFLYEQVKLLYDEILAEEQMD